MWQPVQQLDTQEPTEAASRSKLLSIIARKSQTQLACQKCLGICQRLGSRCASAAVSLLQHPRCRTIRLEHDSVLRCRRGQRQSRTIPVVAPASITSVAAPAALQSPVDRTHRRLEPGGRQGKQQAAMWSLHLRSVATKGSKEATHLEADGDQRVCNTLEKRSPPLSGDCCSSCSDSSGMPAARLLQPDAHCVEWLTRHHTRRARDPACPLADCWGEGSFAAWLRGLRSRASVSNRRGGGTWISGLGDLL